MNTSLDAWSHCLDETDGVVTLRLRGPLCVEPPMEAYGPFYMPWLNAEHTRSLLLACAVDDRCLGVVLEIDSPGGQCYAVPRVVEAMDALCEHKPVIAYAAESMLSALYWVGARAHRVWCASELSRVGSIGTIFNVLDNSENFARNGLAMRSLTDAPLKSMGVDGVPVSEEHEAEYTRQIGLMSELFLRQIGESRGITPKLAESLRGRPVHAAEAVRIGLADAIVPRLELHERAVAEIGAIYTDAAASGGERVDAEPLTPALSPGGRGR